MIQPPWEVRQTATQVIEGTVEKAPDKPIAVPVVAEEPPILDVEKDIHSVLPTVAGTRADRYKRLMHMEGKFRNQQSVHERKAFVVEYIKDFSSIKAVRRLLVGKTRTYYTSKVKRLMNCGYVQLLISMILEEIEEDAIVTRKEVLTALKIEMNCHDPDATSASRVAASKALGKLLGMEVDRSISLSLNAQAPAQITKEDGEEFAALLEKRF